MQVLQYFQLAADAGLVLALLYLAARFTRSSASFAQHKSEELYRNLSALIKEAEQAGQGLNDRLLKRQSQLERSITELGGLETRISTIETTAEGLIAALAAKQTETKSLLANIEKKNSSISHNIVSEQKENINHTSVAQPTSKIATAAPEAVSTFEFEKPESVQVEAAKESEAELPASALNIYGEPIQAATNQASNLSTAIEKEYEAPAATNDIQALETVYDAAEKLLRAGASLPSVAAQTKLPLDEVRILAQLVESNSKSEDAVKVSFKSKNKPLTPDDFEKPKRVFAADEVVTTRADSRLGVLGEMKRQRLTV